MDQIKPTWWSITCADIGNVKGSWNEIAKENNTSAQQVEEEPWNLVLGDGSHLCEDKDEIQPYVDEAVCDAATEAGNSTADCLGLDERWLAKSKEGFA